MNDMTQKSGPALIFTTILEDDRDVERYTGLTVLYGVLVFVALLIECALIEQITVKGWQCNLIHIDTHDCYQLPELELRQLRDSQVLPLTIANQSDSLYQQITGTTDFCFLSFVVLVNPYSKGRQTSTNWLNLLYLLHTGNVLHTPDVHF